ncbi:PF07611 family protein [Leptospira inadai serovar Lyme str. 10]|uniref:PF07611 family protein n=2 Tax=Leptospira inadai serovar Lyme TaxID=293084 RepID=V6HTM2_9LEPT|nr:DUF1574 family protein [Leptospira inadai]EQA36054.1 PF07611 family protein [Leptospira inadai serovar Lyme str. 10]PNV76898.1 DUF1574 domain-containing protein [Leptospira inadai serovar Lyme]
MPTAKNAKFPLFYRKILWIPLGIAALAFFWDKLLSSEWVRPYTESGAEYYFYEMKGRILDTMKKETDSKSPDQKVMTFFGTSHMGEISLSEIHKENPNLIVYNLSAPSAPYSFHTYTLERLLDQKIPLDFAILEYYPDSATDFANRYALRYSYDSMYFLEHWNVFSTTDWDTFLRARVFRTSVFPPRFKEAASRLKHPEELTYLMAIRSKLTDESDRFKGGIPNTLLANTPEDKLDSEAERIHRDTYRNYKRSETQVTFLREFLKKASQNGITVVLWSPLLYSKFTEKVKQSPFYPDWIRLREQLVLEYPKTLVLDLEEYRGRVKCQKFIDPHHLSGGCFAEPTKILISYLEAKTVPHKKNSGK